MTSKIAPGRRGPAVVGGIALAVALVCEALAWSPPGGLVRALAPLLIPRWVAPGYPLTLVAPGTLARDLHVLAASVVGLAGGWLVAPALLRSSASVRRVDLATAAATVVLFALVAWFGLHQFGGTDESLAVDLGWRMVQGQVPYVDFVCTLPVGYALAPRLAFEVLGVSFRSLALLTAGFGAATFLWSVALLRRLVDDGRLALLFAASAHALLVVYTAHWWYNVGTGTAAVLYLLSALLLLRTPDSRGALLSYGAALVLLAGMKPNVAGLLILGGTAILLTSAALRLRVLLTSVTAFAVYVALLAVQGVSLVDVLQSYLSIAGRASPTLHGFDDVGPLERIYELLALELAVSPGMAAVWLRMRSGATEPGLRSTTDLRRTAVLALGAFVALYAVLAHGESKLLDVPSLLVVGVLPVLADRHGVAGVRRWAVAVCALFLVVGVVLGGSRERIQRIGFGAYFEFATSERAPATDFFRDLRAGPRFVAVSEGITTLLAERPGARVFFGPRLEAFYAATRQPSPLGLPPILWHPSTLHPIDQEGALIDAFRRHHADLLFFPRDDYALLPDAFLDLLKADYRKDETAIGRFPELTVYVPR